MAEESDETGAPPPRPVKKSAIPDSMRAVGDIPVKVSIVLGTATIQVSDMLKLDRGAVVELDHKVGDSIEIYANNQLVARGELVENGDGRLAVTMTDIMKSKMSEL